MECWNSSALVRKSGLLDRVSVWDGVVSEGSDPERLSGLVAGRPMYCLRRVVRRFAWLVSCDFLTLRVWISILVWAASRGESSPRAAA